MYFCYIVFFKHIINDLLYIVASFIIDLSYISHVGPKFNPNLGGLENKIDKSFS